MKTLSGRTDVSATLRELDEHGLVGWSTVRPGELLLERTRPLA
jgi:hypothetical protein